MKNKLFTPFNVGNLELKNRFVMSPMTRARSPEGIPTELTAEYYAQRAGAGLIIAEATCISPRAVGYIDTPGVFTDEQVHGWEKVTRAVHDKGGKIFSRLWHVGRVSHTMFQPNGDAPVAPSALPSQMQVFGPDGMLDTSMPRALETEEIAGVVAEYRTAAQNAKTAGFDGVDIHAANGYLIHQFMSADANHRTDSYGGAIENRLRFLLEVVEAVAEVWPRERISVRLGPQIPVPGMSDNSSMELYEALAKSLSGKVGVLQIGELLGDHPMIPPGSGATERFAPKLKEVFGGPVMINGGLTGETAEQAVRDYADLAVFGIPFIANPDLPTRIRIGAELSEAHRATFYGGDEKGYTDYPTWEQTLASQLAEFTRKFQDSVDPEKRSHMKEVLQRTLIPCIEKDALGAGDQSPDFELNDSTGTRVRLSDLLKSGPVVLSFYRGGWCPYCNLELRALQGILPEIKSAHGSLVAVSPELPEFTAENNAQQQLDFPVLSDLGNGVARQFGLVHAVDPEIQDLYKGFGIDLQLQNGDVKPELPMPATFVIDTNGQIQFAFVNVDYTRRAEPHDVLRALNRIPAPAIA